MTAAAELDRLEQKLDDASTRVTIGDAARMLRAAVKDRSYRATPLGLEVARYYRWKKNEWGARPETLRDYEAILARTATYYADLELSDFSGPVGTERLREVWDEYWGDRSARTRAKVRSVWVDFFDWASRERGLYGNPARALASPRRRGVKREPFQQSFVEKVVAAQTYGADRLGCRLVLEYALRRAELAAVQVKDFDFERKRLVVTGKGGKVRNVQIVSAAFWRDLGAFVLEAGLGPDSFLLYRTDKRKVRCGVAEAEETLTLKRETLYYRSRVTRTHARLAPRTVHSWWYGCLERAGIVEGGRDGGGWKGLNMHRGRHTVASEILRHERGHVAGAQKVLGHAHASTTIDEYATFDDQDVWDMLVAIRGEDDEV